MAARTDRKLRRLSLAVWPLLALLVAPAGFAAGVYKWVDGRGLVHYDDTNVLSLRLTQADVDQRRIAPRPGQPTPADFVDQVKRRCEVSRDRLSDYRQARELYGQDPAGNVYLLSPRQVGITLAETERDEQQFCAAHAADALYAQQIAALRRDASAKSLAAPASRRPVASTPLSSGADDGAVR